MNSVGVRVEEMSSSIEISRKFWAPTPRLGAKFSLSVSPIPVVFEEFYSEEARSVGANGIQETLEITSNSGGASVGILRQVT